MRRPSKRLIVSVVLVLALVGTGSYIKDHRKEYHWYYLLRIALHGDVDAQGLLRQYGTQFVPEEHEVFLHADRPDAFYPLWAFRVSNAVPATPVPVVDDTDHDGVPEVYLGSYSPKIYALDGRDGSLLWEWALPFGVVGNVAMAVADLERDGRKELVFGTHWSWPIRAYALRTDKDLRPSQRLKWARNVYGDFIEGGFTVADLGDRQYVVAATRDSPVSRGTLNVIAPNGRFVFRPTRGLDVCLNRPAIGSLPGTSGLCVIHGSHQFYGATYGHRITARDLQTGTVLWSTPLPGDTGFQNHQIVDLDFDGQNEVVGMAGSGQYFALDGRTGAVLPRPLEGSVVGVIEEAQLICFRGDRVVCKDRQGRTVYELPNFSFGIRFAEDERLHLVALSYHDRTVVCDVYDALTGQPEQHFEAPLYVQQYRENDRSVYGGFGGPGEGVAFKTLADVDGDGYWDALVQDGGFIVAIHLPFKVHAGYDPYAPIMDRNVTNVGRIYDVPSSAVHAQGVPASTGPVQQN